MSKTPEEQRQHLEKVMARLKSLGKPKGPVVPDILTRRPTPAEIEKKRHEDELAHRNGPLGRGGI